MKKLGTFFWSLTPFLLAITIQTIAMMYIMILTMALFSGNGRFDMDALLYDSNYNALIFVVFSISCSVIFSIWAYRSCGTDFKFNPRKEAHPLHLIGILLMVPGTQFATSLLISFIVTIFPKWLEDYEALMESAGMDENITLLMLFYTVLCAPVSEELIFRGVTLRIARRAFPFWVANIIQAVLFGAFHMNMLQGCYAAALGLILGYIAEKCGSIYFAIFFHFLYNFWGAVISPLIMVENDALAVILILVGTFVILPLGLSLVHKGNERVICAQSRPENPPEPDYPI